MRVFLSVCLFLCLFEFSYGVEEKKPKYPEMESKTKTATAVDGFLKIWQEDNQAWMEIPKVMLDQEFFYFVSLSGGTLAYMLPHWIIDQKVVYFRKVGKDILLFEKDTFHTADKGSSAEKAVEKAYLDSLLGSFPIIAADKSESKFLISLNAHFFSAGSAAIPRWMGMAFGIHGINPATTFWSSIKGYPKNMELEIQATLRMDEQSKWFGLSNQARFYFSLVKKEKSSYQPRIADDRIGYFTTDRKDFSRQSSDDGIVRYVNRWNLEKSDASSDTSVVKAPIIYHLDSTIPEKYRKYVRAGVLEWNKAFEKAGYLGAVEARLPEAGQTWDPSDVRYSTISWATSEDTFAIGPSRVDPLTGEILDADIIVSSGYIAYMEKKGEGFGAGGEEDASPEPSKDSVKNQKKELRKKMIEHGIYPCEHQNVDQIATNFVIYSTVMKYKLDTEAYTKWKESFIGAFIKDLVMHEVGHTLGLRHNFKASSTVEFAKLMDSQWLKENQPFSSVMDYNDLIISLDHKKQGKYMNDSIGEYDYLAILYGYDPVSGKKEKARLEEIAASVVKKGLDYGTDEDAYLGNDPFCKPYDLSRDMVKTAKHRILLAQSLLNSVENQLVTTGQRYDRLRFALYSLLGDYRKKTMDVVDLIGGVHSHRDHHNDPDARLPYVPVNKADVEDALQYLQDFVYANEVLKVPSTLISKARQNPWDWYPNVPVMADNFFRMVGREVINRVFYSGNMFLIAEYHEKHVDQPLTLASLFDRFHEMIFGPLSQILKGKQADLSTHFIHLQEYYLDVLSEMVLEKRTAPVQARLYARHSIDLLEKTLKELNVKNTDSGFEKAKLFVHYQSLLEKIERLRSAVILKRS